VELVVCNAINLLYAFFKSSSSHQIKLKSSQNKTQNRFKPTNSTFIHTSHHLSGPQQPQTPLHLLVDLAGHHGVDTSEVTDVHGDVGL
jgi:hypothetical protein